MVRGIFLLLPSLLSVVVHANDWSEPCFGECSYDISGSGVSGTVYISGSSSAVSDITTAGGWDILDCDSDSTAQDIRAICGSGNSTCDHLYEGGAIGTIVRLPENCTQMPFARISDTWDHEDQSMPAEKRSRLFYRQGSAVVKGFSLDTNFSAIDPSQYGNVSFWVQGTSMPGASFASASTSGKRALHERSSFGWVQQSLNNISQFSKNVSENVPPINVQKQGVLFNESIACPAIGNIPPFAADVAVAIDAQVDATLQYGVAVSGTLVPPEMSEFGLFAGLSGSIDGTLIANATAATTLTTGIIPLLQVGIPVLDIPGILTIGPTFELNVEATAMLDVDLNLAVGLNYNISNAELYFPPSSNSATSGGIFMPGDTNVQLSASPNVTSQTTLTAHLIPTVAFGINALSGVAQATVDLDLDASVTLDLDLQASMSSNTTGNTTGSAFGGSVNITSEFDVNAGADASFLAFFDKSTTVTLFSKTFELFQENFGNAAAKRMARRAPRPLRRSSLTCPVVALETIESIIDIEKAASSLSG
ncbi:hypothetical protein BKA93DRAFT_211137 [Sparassis latifolia]